MRSESHYHYGAHEMTDDDHRHLNERVARARAAVVISGYHCSLYDEELYAGWPSTERRARGNSASDRLEVLWIKPAGVTFASRSAVQHTLGLEDQT